MSIHNNVFIPNSRKRARDDGNVDELDRRSFTIRPDTKDPFAAPRTFTPLCLLARSQLPLAYLDTPAPGHRRFTAHVSILEASHDHGNEATVLVARESKEGEVYAIERVKRNVHALCRLGDWVTEEDVLARSKSTIWKEESQAKRRALQTVEGGHPWWMTASVAVPDVDRQDVARPRLSMACGVASDARVALPTCEVETASLDTARPAGQEDEAAAMPRSPTDIMQELTKQYLDALYLSRTSLAYFTKGPLSRARAAIANISEDNTMELVNFLRESILTSTTMDKKYKDGIADVVREMSVSVTDHAAKKPKRKRKWKSKRDKHGFFVDEKDVVEHWWRSEDDSTLLNAAETVGSSLRRRLPRIRSRETFLQIILVLETLALEASMPAHAASRTSGPEVAAESQAAGTQQEDSQAPNDARKQKLKKKQDLPALLETLLDKLCIWHSLNSHSPSKSRGAKDGDGNDEVHDELKSFCIEVVMPFYASRTLQYATIVSKKLGGPTAPTPVKRTSNTTRKPGEPAIRQPPEKKSRKPLSRVGTETRQTTARAPPSLLRSSTDSDVLSAHIKREASEVPLESIPTIPPARKPRTSLMHSLSSSRRQVDLNAMSQASEAKLRQQTEMRDAIKALRKPNRMAAVKEIADRTDESFAKVTADAKKRPSASMKRAKTTVGVTVTATPSHVRTVKATPHKRASITHTHHDHVRSSATTHITNSSAATTQHHDFVPTSSFAVPQTNHRPRHAPTGTGVEETPSRGFAKFMPAGLARQPGTLESPTASRKVVATPAKPVRSLALGVVGTPASAAGLPLVAASPNVVRLGEVESGGGGGGGGGKGDDGGRSSVYDSLGWDEEYEELV